MNLHICKLNMGLSKAVVCKLKPSAEDFQKLFRTLKAFRDACNYISRVAFERVATPEKIEAAVSEEERTTVPEKGN